MRRILVTGSRDWTDLVAIEKALVTAAMRGQHDVMIIHGGAPGADALADQTARTFGWAIEVHRADWGRYGRAAGPRRNTAMAEAGADVCLAFPLPGSRGTIDMIKKARAADIPIQIYGNVKVD